MRVQVAVAQKAGNECRFARRDGTLTSARPCGRKLWLAAKRGKQRLDGKIAWQLKIKQLQAGSYVAKVRARDGAGNTERPRRRSNRAAFTVR